MSLLTFIPVPVSPYVPIVVTFNRSHGDVLCVCSLNFRARAVALSATLPFVETGSVCGFSQTNFLLLYYLVILYLS